MKTYGYCRCSTNETRQNINRQVKELKELGADDLTIYKEYVSGNSKQKSELEKLMNVISEGDSIVVTEISRLSRSTKQLIEFLDFVKERKIKLVIKNSITIDCTGGNLDIMSKAFVQMAGVFAELEHDIICERVKSGVACARAKGKQIGRPHISYCNIPKKVKDSYDLYVDGKISKTDYAKLCEISRPTLDRYLLMLEERRKG